MTIRARVASVPAVILGLFLTNCRPLLVASELAQAKGGNNPAEALPVSATASAPFENPRSGTLSVDEIHVDTDDGMKKAWLLAKVENPKETLIAFPVTSTSLDVTSFDPTTLQSLPVRALLGTYERDRTSSHYPIPGLLFPQDLPNTNPWKLLKLTPESPFPTDPAWGLYNMRKAGKADGANHQPSLVTWDQRSMGIYLGPLAVTLTERTPEKDEPLPKGTTLARPEDWNLKLLIRFGKQRYADSEKEFWYLADSWRLKARLKQDSQDRVSATLFDFGAGDANTKLTAELQRQKPNAKDPSHETYASRDGTALLTRSTAFPNECTATFNWNVMVDQYHNGLTRSVAGFMKWPGQKRVSKGTFTVSGVCPDVPDLAERAKHLATPCAKPHLHFCLKPDGDLTNEMKVNVRDTILTAASRLIEIPQVEIKPGLIQLTIDPPSIATCDWSDVTQPLAEMRNVIPGQIRDVYAAYNKHRKAPLQPAKTLPGDTALKAIAASLVGCKKDLCKDRVATFTATYECEQESSPRYDESLDSHDARSNSALYDSIWKIPGN